MKTTNGLSPSWSGAQPAELAVWAAELEHAPAEDVITWAVGRFGGSLSLACSFQDCVIIDLAVKVDPRIEVVFLDTGFHFEETLSFVDEVAASYDLNLRVVRPGDEADSWPCGSEKCCQLRKVAPLDRVLAGRGAWMTAVKRCDSPTRVLTPVLGWDPSHAMVKVNPLALWTHQDVDDYIAAHSLPSHPLVSRGYLSIGCAPVTSPVAAGADPRSGRWAGSKKTECGLHS